MSAPRANEADAREPVPVPPKAGVINPHHISPSQHVSFGGGINTVTTTFPGGVNPWFVQGVQGVQGQPPSPLPWAAAWMPVPQQPPISQGWIPPVPPSSSQGNDANYMVDALRRIYNNDDGSIEIERVKVQKRTPGDTRQIVYTSGDSRALVSQSLTPICGTELNERRPPPRKNKIKKKLQQMKESSQIPTNQNPIAQPWYPYMPYMPMYPPYPYPYCYGYPMWPGSSPPNADEWRLNVESIESDRVSSRQESLPITNDSQRLDSRLSESFRDSKSPELRQSVSPSRTSQITDSQATDVAPSDSISIGGYNRDTSTDRELRSPTPSQSNQSHISEDFTSNDIGKTREWMLDMQKALLPPPAESNTASSEKVSFTTASSDIPKAPKAPTRKNKGKSRLKELQKDENRETPLSFSESFDDTNTGSVTDLSIAFKDLQKSVNDFKSQVSLEYNKINGDQNKSKKEDIETSSLHKSDDDISKTETLVVSQIESEKSNQPLMNENKKELENKTTITANLGESEKVKSVVDISSNEETLIHNTKAVSMDSVMPNQVLNVLGDSKDFHEQFINSKQDQDQDGRASRASTCSYHSTRPSTDDQLIFMDTDSTDIHIPTGDEVIDQI